MLLLFKYDYLYLINLRDCITSAKAAQTVRPLTGSSREIGMVPHAAIRAPSSSKRSSVMASNSRFRSQAIALLLMIAWRASSGI